MHMIMKVEMSVGKANAAARSGQLGQTIQRILDDTRPEGAWFTAMDGKRCAFLVFDLERASDIPRIAEPWFLAFDADIDFYPAMSVQDLAQAGEGIAHAVDAFGGEHPAPQAHAK